MPQQVLFVQGAGEGTHDQWDNKLVASLEARLGPDYAVRYPRMPGEDEPRYPDWKAALTGQFGTLEDGAILVGHSIGGTILLHLLAEERHKLKPGAIILIAAPFIGDGGWPDTGIPPCGDFEERLPAGVPVFLYHGTADTTVPCAHVELHAKAITRAMVRVLADRDHQLNDDLGEVARDIRSLSLR